MRKRNEKNQLKQNKAWQKKFANAAKRWDGKSKFNLEIKMKKSKTAEKNAKEGEQESEEEVIQSVNSSQKSGE